MQSRVENDGLACDHAVPSNTRQHAEQEVGPQTVVPQQNNDGVEDYAEGGDHHAAEIKTVVALEAGDEGDDDLEAVVEGDGEEAGDGHVDGEGDTLHGPRFAGSTNRHVQGVVVGPMPVMTR
ncbi:hypothetical protein QX201_007293 [Fusarium graminearum]|uniref:Uncharacterized protein n=1 Tax=Gibberella zeae (strain ATCC MYA-4620 / CBS 123657 / FGSC 9075 / NRRL 31084 / PH-1) TaxID=229533 RepID=A0A098DKF4_GIBZE|nr:hypothetical protein HG531_000200 [Fusarium graminearum]